MTKSDISLKKTLRKYTKVVLKFLNDIQGYFDVEGVVSFYIPRIRDNQEDKESAIALYQIPEAREFKKEMRAHPIVWKHLDVHVGTERGSVLLGVWNIFQDFLLHLIRIQRSLVYDAKSFEKSFKDMMRFFRSTTLSVQFVAMLENIDMFSDDDILLKNGWHLKRLSKMLQDDMTRVIGDDFLHPKHKYVTHHSLVKEFKLKKIILKPGVKRSHEITTQVTDEIDILLSAFRIAKSGRIVCRDIDYQILGWHPFGDRMSIIDANDSVEPGTMYSFSKEDTNRINEILDLLSYCKSDKILQIPLRRLRYATERKHAIPEDRILDAMIAFDSLFGVYSEMSYRLSLRIAMFLGESSEDRLKLKNDFVSAYNLRSRIIHGNKPKHVRKVLREWGLNRQQAADYLEDILRKAVVKYMRLLKSGKTHDEIIQTLEDMILNDASKLLI